MSIVDGFPRGTTACCAVPGTVVAVNIMFCIPIGQNYSLLHEIMSVLLLQFISVSKPLPYSLCSTCSQLQ